MKAFILAAGLGTRLLPYTETIPKALVELSGKSLLQRAIEKISELDVSEIIVNIHHFGDQVIDYLANHDNFGKRITLSDERSGLLDTGGAILNARQFLETNEPFLVYNVDVLSSVDLGELLSCHTKRAGLATMAVRKRQTSRYLIFDDNMQLSGWRNVQTNQTRIRRDVHPLTDFAYSGIQIIDPEIFSLITETGKFSLIELYLRLAATEEIFGYEDQTDFWMDLGKPDQLILAGKLLNNMPDSEVTN